MKNTITIKEIKLGELVLRKYTNSTITINDFDGKLKEFYFEKMVSENVLKNCDHEGKISHAIGKNVRLKKTGEWGNETYFNIITKENNKDIKNMTKEQAYEIAADNIEKYLTAEYGKRLVSDNEDPLSAYIQDANSLSQAGEIFSVDCPGIGNLDMSYYRNGWDCKNLSDEEVIIECCESDMSDEIDDLTEKIFQSANDID